MDESNQMYASRTNVQYNIYLVISGLSSPVFTKFSGSKVCSCAPPRYTSNFNLLLLKLLRKWYSWYMWLLLKTSEFVLWNTFHQLLLSVGSKRVYNWFLKFWEVPSSSSWEPDIENTQMLPLNPESAGKQKTVFWNGDPNHSSPPQKVFNLFLNELILSHPEIPVSIFFVLSLIFSHLYLDILPSFLLFSFYRLFNFFRWITRKTQKYTFSFFYQQISFSES
jgi:hypothetical protein